MQMRLRIKIIVHCVQSDYKLSNKNLQKKRLIYVIITCYIKKKAFPAQKNENY